MSCLLLSGRCCDDISSCDLQIEKSHSHRAEAAPVLLSTCAHTHTNQSLAAIRQGMHPASLWDPHLWQDRRRQTEQKLKSPFNKAFSAPRRFSTDFEAQ